MIKIQIGMILLIVPFYIKGQVLERERIDVSVSLPEISIIDLAPSTATIELIMRAPSQAGSPLDMSTAMNDSKWINYTASISEGGARKNITAQVLSGELPRGLKLMLKTGKYTGSGKGSTGRPRKEIELTHLPKLIIGNIGGSYTGTGVQQGHNITFALAYDNYEDIDFGTSTMVVAFTLTDN